MNGTKPPIGTQYFCRGCGRALPSDWHGDFHPECLKLDKRRRVQEKRRLERERFQLWLERQHCPECGASMGSRSNAPAPAKPSPRSEHHANRIPDVILQAAGCSAMDDG